jgi:predicted nucleotidyltransferase
VFTLNYGVRKGLRTLDSPNHQDYVLDKNGNLFQVITSCHPPDRVIALLRYVQASDQNDPNAIWQPKRGTIKGIRYRRQLEAYNVNRARSNVDFVEAAQSAYVLRDTIYGVPMIAVPRAMIEVHYQPRLRLQEVLELDASQLDYYEIAARQIAISLRDYLGVPPEHVGITGSILWGAQHRYSDIDIIIYGQENKARLVAHYPELHRADPQITGLNEQWTEEFAQSLQEKSGLPLAECYQYIGRKSWLMLYHEPQIRPQPIQVGIYFAPTVDEAEQVYRPYGQEWYESIATLTVEADITDDSASLYYPALYSINGVVVTESASQKEAQVKPADIKRIFLFEGAISGYAFVGDRVRVRGLLQRIRSTTGTEEEAYQILIGTKENHSREYIQVLARHPGH